jgi:indolepyruvate ferredoxin oxidoreductase alpha subunit
MSAGGSSTRRSNAVGPAGRAETLTGNEAIARGAWEAGVGMAAAYPGTPSTEILETLAQFPAEDLHAQWSTNEKVALDVAIGASFAGVRSLAAMKHVGLNVAADPLMSQTYIGVNGGLVLTVSDDPGIHSSQNEQDTRLFGRFAMAPVLDPSDAEEARIFTALAFEISEQFDTPVILRSTTRLSHTRSTVKLGERKDPPKRAFVDDPAKNVIIPSHARLRHPLLLEREKNLEAYFAESELTRWEKGSADFGIITHGTAYAYVKEVAPEAHVLKLGACYPLAKETVRKFCESVDRVIVVEELEPMMETDILAMGIQVDGKNFVPRAGELSPEVVRTALEEAGLIEAEAAPVALAETDELARPPVLCAGCPHMTSYLTMRNLGARIAGDIGCYTLAALDPLRAIDTTVSMGSGIGNAIGMALSGNETKPVVATIGDSTFLHSGIAPLIDAVYNSANITVFLLDNKITAMTGGQDHPGTGRTLRGDAAPAVDYENLIKAIGVGFVRRVDPYDLADVQQTCREALDHKGVSVVIAERPCVLDPVRIKGETLTVEPENCTACQACMNLGCPAITWSDELFEGHHKVKIDEALCIGCTLCAQLCTNGCITVPSPVANPGGITVPVAE